MQTIGGSKEKVYTKFGTEVYVREEVDQKIRNKMKYYYTATEVDKKFETLATTSDVATNKDNINDLKNKAATTDATLTGLSGRMAAAESDIDGLQADMSTAKSDIGTLKSDMSTAKFDIGTLKSDMSTAKSDIGTLKTKDTELGQKIDAETANRITSDTALDQKIDKEIQDRENAIKATNDRTGGIARNLEGTQTTIEGIVKVDNQGNVKDVKELSAEMITTKEDAVIGGDLKVTGETTLNDKLTAKGEATFEKNLIAEKDLTVNGKLNVGEIYLENNKLEAATGKNHDSATAITADGISNLAKVTDKNGNTTESKFTHNEEGTFNYAKEEKITGEWKGSTSNVTADGVSNKMTDSAGNKHTYYQTATESKEQLVNGDKSNFEKKTAEGNTISIKDKDAAGNDKSLTNKQTVDGEKTFVTNKESSSTINQGADQISNHVTSADGKKSSTEVKADGITNTSKDGTITNDAKDIVNNATGNMTNTVGADLTTTVGGNELHEVTGTKTENVTGKVKENYKAGQETNVTGDQDIYVTGKQTNKIDGDQENTIDGSQTTTVTGDISNTAENITNEANTKLTDKVGDNTRVLDSEGITDTVGGSTFKQRIDKIMMESKDVSIKAEETLTNEAKVITNKASEDINNEAVNINNTATGIITSKASEIKNQADKLISNKVGENTLEKMEDGKITTSITKGTKANTVISTVDGTRFENSEAAAPVTGDSGAGTAVNTTIKGNTITTGKVTMDYAEVMKDLGVHGSAKVDNNLEVGDTTTTKTLKVTENATVGGTLDVTKKATFRDDVDIKKNLSVVGDVTANSYKVGDKTYIDANGINANNQKITNVADGSISEGSKDAVNGGQLYGVKRDLEHQVDKVGANAAAMANLRPMEFDPSSKWNIAAAIGNYGSETAAALGAFYRPNDNVMVNLSTAFGTGENMVGGGVSVRLGKGGNKLSREETNALKAQVADLTARMDALLSVLNPNMSKDFPDVPENHWAYEAVSRLAGNDIVQGYPDGEFHGERTMTRYEMAEIIYNALSRGAEAEKELVEEFKPELQAMAASEKATAEKAEGKTEGQVRSRAPADAAGRSTLSLRTFRRRAEPCIYIVVNRGPLYLLPDDMELPLLKYISRPAALCK